MRITRRIAVMLGIALVVGLIMFMILHRKAVAPATVNEKLGSENTASSTPSSTNLYVNDKNDSVFHPPDFKGPPPGPPHIIGPRGNPPNY